MLEKVITHTDRGGESERQCSSRQGGESAKVCVCVCVCVRTSERAWTRQRTGWLVLRGTKTMEGEWGTIGEKRVCVCNQACKYSLFSGRNNHDLWPSVIHVFCTLYNAHSTCWPPSEHCEKCFIREDCCQPLAQPLQSSKASLSTANTSVCAITASNPNPVTRLYSRHTCYLLSR